MGTIKIKCKNCDKKLSTIYGSRYCSKICSSRFNYDKKVAAKSIGQSIKCRHCEKEFTIKKKAPSLFCSKKCVASFYTAEPKPRECKNCGKSFVYTKSNQVYCSKECCKTWNKNKLLETKIVTYFDIFKYDNFTCQYCGRTPADGIKLVVDHIYPVKEKDIGDRFNLTTACTECNLTKSATLLSLEETVKRWKANPNTFENSKAEEYWRRVTTQRKNR